MITIKIKTDNAAFQDDRAGEIARILQSLVAKLETCAPLVVYDSNGNKCGSVTLTGPDRRL